MRCIGSNNTRLNITMLYLCSKSTFNGRAYCKLIFLTHWGRVTHICVSKLICICSDNGLSLSRRQAIIWTNAGILLIGHLETNFSEILNEIYTFSFKKMDLKISFAKWRPFSLSLNVLMIYNEVYLTPVFKCPFDRGICAQLAWKYKSHLPSITILIGRSVEAARLGSEMPDCFNFATWPEK